LRARFDLPLPPSINQQYATVQGRRVLSRASREYKEAVTLAIQRLRETGAISQQLPGELQRGFIGLFIDFYFETPHRRDLDGGLNFAQDAMCEALEVNDNGWGTCTWSSGSIRCGRASKSRSRRYPSGSSMSSAPTWAMGRDCARSWHT